MLFVVKNLYKEILRNRMVSFTKKRNSGFTMIEMLCALAIISLLLLFAIPSISGFQAKLKMRQLDDISRQIFLSTQNRLTTMSAVGSLDSLNNELLSSYSTNKLAFPPSDHPAGDDTWNKLYFVTSKIGRAHV